MSGSENEIPSSKMKIWITAVRPFAYTASVSAVVLGLALTHYAGFDINWLHFIMTLAGVVCVHTAANLLNDVYDFKNGVDTMVLPVSGAVVRGWLTPEQVKRAAMVFLTVGFAIGIYLVFVIGWMILFICLIGIALTLLYTTPGFSLKYIGLGDMSFFFLYGMLPVFGTFWVQTQTFSILPILWSIPLVFYTVGILHSNNWHDIETDTEKGCVTVASKLGHGGSAKYYKALMLVPFLLVCSYVVLGLIPGLDLMAPAPMLALIVFLAFPTAYKLAKFKKEDDMQKFMMLDGVTAQMQMKFGILLTIGLFVSPYITEML